MTSKRFVYLFLFFSILFLLFSIYEKVVQNTKFKSDFYRSTSIVVRNKFINLGKISINSDISDEFRIINVGESKLIIEKVEVSCRCTSFASSNEPISKGDSISILVNYTKRNVGYFYSDVLVYGNFDNSPLVMSFEGFVIEK